MRKQLLRRGLHFRRAMTRARTINHHLARVRYCRRGKPGWIASVSRPNTGGAWSSVIGVYRTPEAAFDAAEARIGIACAGDEHICTPAEIGRVRKEARVKR